jgi:hypothetical protein
MGKIYLLILIFLLGLNPYRVSSQSFSDLITNGVNLFTEGSFNYNFWMPDESYRLDYQTEGFQNIKIDTRFTHAIPILPELRFTWETNFNARNQDELLQVHNQATSLETSYNRLMFLAGFGKRFARKTGRGFDPRRSNSIFDLSYSKETFYISVSPNSGTLYFAPYNSTSLQTFFEGSELSMFTKFEEIKGTFNTDGFAILPAFFSALFGGNAEVMELSGADTRLGGFYAQFFKPYNITQVISYGSSSGNRDYIYNARFQSYGLVEEYSFMGDYASFKIQMNLGLAQINLQEKLLLEESESPLFFYYKHSMNLQIHIPIWQSRLLLNLGGAYDWSFMWGGQYSAESELIETKSFINSDMIFKANGSIIINI